MLISTEKAPLCGLRHPEPAPRLPPTLARTMSSDLSPRLTKSITTPLPLPRCEPRRLLQRVATTPPPSGSPFGIALTRPTATRARMLRRAGVRSPAEFRGSEACGALRPPPPPCAPSISPSRRNANLTLKSGPPAVAIEAPSDPVTAVPGVGLTEKGSLPPQVVVAEVFWAGGCPSEQIATGGDRRVSLSRKVRSGGQVEAGNGQAG